MTLSSRGVITRMSLRNLFHRKKSIFFSWLASYFVIIIVCVLISSIVYYQAGTVVSDDMNHTSEILIRQVQQSIDSRLRDMIVLGNQVSMDDALSGMYCWYMPLTNNEFYAMKQVIKDFRMVRAANTYINFFYVYLNNIDSVPASDGSYSKDILYQTIHQGDGISFEQWTALERQEHRGDFIPLYKNGARPSRKTIAYMKTLSLNDEEHMANLTILFDEQRLLEAVRNVNLVNESSVCIIDDGDDLITSSGNTGFAGLRYASLKDAAEISHQAIGGRKMVLTHLKSEVTDWEYVVAVPDSVFMQKVDQMRMFTYASILACILLSGLIAYSFAKRNYNPVYELMNYIAKIQKKENKKAPDNCNEFSFLRDFIKSNQDEKEKYYRGWEQHGRELKVNFLSRLLKGEIDPGLSLQDMLENYHIRFPGDHFAVLLVSVENYGSIFKEKNYRSPDLVKFAISNVMEELANQKNAGYMIDCGDMLACLVCLKEGTGDHEGELSRISEKARLFFEHQLEIVVTVSCSPVHGSVQEIAAAYQEAAAAMDYKVILGEGTVIRFNDIRPSQNRYPYSFGAEHRLMNSIRAGDYESAGQNLKQIFDEIKPKDYLSIEMTRCLMFGIVNTMVQTIFESGEEESEPFLEALNPVSRILTCKTLSAMEGEINEILRQICDYKSRSRKKCRTDSRTEKIIAYVQAHYKDENLNISGIAEAFGMNPIYLSRFFREKTGEALLDYIVRFRIGKAKQYLEQGYSIYNTATEVGYNNYKTFIRAFKKFEGVTPGRYPLDRDGSSSRPPGISPE